MKIAAEMWGTTFAEKWERELKEKNK